MKKELVYNVITQATGYKSNELEQLEASNNVKARIKDFRQASDGIGRFIYYSDTCAFYKANKSAIVEACREMMEDLGEGEKGLSGFVASFNCLDDWSVSEIEEGLYEGGDAEKPLSEIIKDNFLNIETKQRAAITSKPFLIEILL